MVARKTLVFLTMILCFPIYGMQRSLSDLTLDDIQQQQQSQSRRPSLPMGATRLSQMEEVESFEIAGSQQSAQIIAQATPQPTIDLKASLVDYQAGISNIFDMQEQKISSLKLEVSGLKQQLQMKDDQINTLQNSLLGSQQSLSDLTSQVNSLEGELSTVRQELQQKTISLQEAVTRNQALEQRIEQIKEFVRNV